MLQKELWVWCSQAAYGFAWSGFWGWGWRWHCGVSMLLLSFCTVFADLYSISMWPNLQFQFIPIYLEIAKAGWDQSFERVILKHDHVLVSNGCKWTYSLHIFCIISCCNSWPLAFSLLRSCSSRNSWQGSHMAWT